MEPNDLSVGAVEETPVVETVEEVPSEEAKEE